MYISSVHNSPFNGKIIYSQSILISLIRSLQHHSCQLQLLSNSCSIVQHKSQCARSREEDKEEDGDDEEGEVNNEVRSC